MRSDSLTLESDRLTGYTLDHYPLMHERHRIFPEVFEDRTHNRILDTSAGIGVVARRILENYPCTIDCNEVDPLCLGQLRKLNLRVSSFDLDSLDPLPIEDRTYDALVCLATLEHLVNIDHFTRELHRILKDDGRLYLSVPNYAALYWLLPLLRGRTFHDPFDERSRYEFYAHIRYFTYRTLVEYMRRFGFTVDTVYLPLPQGSTKFEAIRRQSRAAAALIRLFLRSLYTLSPRWHQEPVICFARKELGGKPRKKIL